LNDLHQNKITHGDIKPEHIFCDLTMSKQAHQLSLAYLADLGGAIDHSENSIPLQITTSSDYRLRSDDLESEKAYYQKDYIKYKKIETKADVFAISASLCMIFTNEMPYDEESTQLDSLSLKNDLEEKLQRVGLSQNTIELLIRGLNVDYQNRPDTFYLLEAIKADLQQLSSEHMKKLEQLTKDLKNAA
jgi:serine/threonine protein kinase